MIKAIQPNTLGLLLICLASIFFTACDSSPKLSSTSKETGLQSVKKITSFLSEKEAKEFSLAIEIVESGMDLFILSIHLKKYDGKYPSQQRMKIEAEESKIYRIKYEDMVWARLDGQSVKQIISLGEISSQWISKYNNCMQAALTQDIFKNAGKMRDPTLTIKEHCIPTKPEFNMPSIYRDY